MDKRKLGSGASSLNGTFKTTQIMAIAMGIIALCVISGSIGASVTHGVKITYNSKMDINYADLVTIVLAALSLMITILAIVLAIFGVIGWNSISDKAKDTTHTYLQNAFEEGNELHKLVKEEVQRIRYSGIQAIPAGNIPTEDDADNPTDETEA